MAWNPFAGLFRKEKPLVKPPPVVVPGTLPPEPKPLDHVSGTARFACKLFVETLRQESSKNVFISPASISFALTMTYNGAAGETQAEMAQALELQGMSLEDVNAGAKVLKTLLERKEPKVEFAIANSLWAKLGVEFKAEFVKYARTYYAAELRTLDFEKPDAASEINAWVSEKTRGKISDIVDERALKELQMLLINALYFKGDWAEGFEFKKERTENRSFHVLNGSTRNVPLMGTGGTYSYLETPSLQMVRIPYGKHNVSMIVLLPRKDRNFAEFCGAISAGQWEAWIAAMYERAGWLMLPRFKLNYETELSDVLKPLGLKRAFNSLYAQFPAMSETPVFISKVKHKTFVDVNETGTEAAAVTSVEMALCTGIPEPDPVIPFQMIVDRPFVCAIRDDRTGTLLFMGAIVEP